MKTQGAVPFVDEAKRFMKALSGIKSERDLQKLLGDPTTRDALISAAGLSNKARGHLSQDELDQAALNVLHQFFSAKRRDFKNKVNRIEWPERLMLFNRTPRFISKNIDVIMLDLSHSHQKEADLLETPAAFLACGELKGGIDPAGADEHWKTARSALNRIVESFEKIEMVPPPLFFIGAAIAKAMGEEIYGHLKNGKLAHAANLTQDAQVQDLANWIVSL